MGCVREVDLEVLGRIEVVLTRDLKDLVTTFTFVLVVDGRFFGGVVEWGC